ncbi:uncharacterized protein BO66DRAFT_430387 [Aspergillus aculeatinus CBS 121060]|uniref:Uncharacterized protein n=1 Tax=Aspergillus aculeatinus CBS 121060 TaxID=1448322 RepID=A0ACD1H2N4_9EURO|nr:hypothetical protein BO66DRAFT_430387 [Aspergillus aculeatinus CBS 121060]RAH67875.1 hypothetical protein BO66DRAFT_430387 [Aspergillus aculeatinus CBS 121060]
MWSSRNILAALALVPLSAAFNNPPGVDIWCGKAYRASNASFNPGGWFEEPSHSATPLLNLKVRPRMSIYLSNDPSGSLLVDTSVSHRIGDPLPLTATASSNHSAQALHLRIDISDTNGTALTSITNYTLPLDTRNNEIPIPLQDFPARLQPYTVTVHATLPSSNATSKNPTTFTKSTSLYRLPRRTDGGSATRIDNLYGGLAYQTSTEESWTSIFPYTYYAQWTLYWDTSPTTLTTFTSQNYNVIHIVPTGALSTTTTAYPWTTLDPYLTLADHTHLKFQYDLLFDPTNTSTMLTQAQALHTHPSLLLWYLADEPDGKATPPTTLTAASTTLKTLDPYHPISLALNCANFHYEEYASAADIILSDVYPVATNTSWSSVYDTPCNATYGCCGCDDCSGRFEDIAARLDTFRGFDEAVGWEKVHWAAPQAFGNETFWTRYPSAREEVVMNLLGVNHGAMGVVMWDFPTSAEISAVTGELAGVVTSAEITGFLVGTERRRVEVGGEGRARVDVAGWVDWRAKRALVSVVNLKYEDTVAEVVVGGAGDWEVKAVEKVVWGEVQWRVEGGKLVVDGLVGLEVSLVIVELV